MKKQLLLIGLVLAMVSVLAFTTGALAPNPAAAAPGGDQGPPDGKGPGGGTPDYGDLIILYRTDDGVPIPSEAVLVPDASTEDPDDEVSGGLCWQPIATEDIGDVAWDAPTDRVVYPNDKITQVPGGWLIPVDQYNCAVEAAFATYTQEVDFGRINEARSPEDVFLSQLEDVVTKLAVADTTSLDPAGRMVASTCPDDVVTTSTIDSPLQSLAIYRQLLLTGSIGTALPEGAGILDTAARGLGAASDKSGGVNVDMVAYLNQLMGLDDMDTILDPSLCETYREEVQGVIQEVDKCFLNYGSYNYNYNYNRSANFGALPNPAYIPDDAGAGWFEYLVSLNTDPPTFGIGQGPILNAVFPDGEGNFIPFEDSNIGGFAQAADDTRAVIDFMHTNPLPIGEETPVPCDPSVGTFVDVSISDVSGLQVPRRMVDGSEGREFIVTIANAGPDDAAGTVTVTAITEDGTAIADPWTFTFTGLAAGESRVWTTFFSIDIGARTTITWTAAIEAANDVNPGNNSVTEETKVVVKGGSNR